LATLVLSTVGTALGGPLGGAIGALIGQSIDQELLAPTRRGPRVGDLGVQSSSYGTQIPRIYGTMRVAGSVVWSTDLVEHSQTGGAKGQPDVTYSYTVSFAVALSSRRAGSVSRIRADSKLLRGAAGDLKVGGKLRFYDGDEDQAIDPLVGSVEGIANTPAYRGLALAVFEDLELGDYGNRIPFLTFEVQADEGSPTVGFLLIDASGGVIVSDATQQVIGFAAYGSSIKSSVDPLVSNFGIDLFDDGTTLRAPIAASPLVIGDELGNSVDNSTQPRLQRDQAAVRSVPAALRLTYYDPDRDYQTGEARSVAGEDAGTEVQQELPAVLTADDAKSLAQQILARTWAERDKLTLRLPPARLAIEPGSKLVLPLNPALWTVGKTTIDGFVIVAELHPTLGAVAAVVGDGGRIVSNVDVAAGPVTLALLDVPNVVSASNEPSVLLASSAVTTGWKRSAVAITFGGQQISAETARTKSLLGNAATVLAAADTSLIDDQNSVDVQLLDADQWLTSCDDDALASGTNLAALGSELVQFGSAISIGEGRFQLSHLLRGRGGTEWACGGHATGEPFCLLQPLALQSIALPSWAIGADVGASTAGGIGTSILFAGETLRPPSPVNLAAESHSNGDLAITWTRRSRQGFAWIDGVDAPLGESAEQYRVRLTGAAGTIEATADQPNLAVVSTDLASLGIGPVSIEVAQIGDLAASHAAQLNIQLS
jgi:hypothetical protein